MQNSQPFAIAVHCEMLSRVVYPPGLEFHILHDGLLIAEVVGIEAREVRQYEEYFAKLVRIAGASDFIRCHDFGALQRRSGLDPSASLEQLRSEAEQWWQLNRGTADWRLRFRKTLGMMNLREFSTTLVASLLHHARLGRLPRGFEPLERRVHEAMVQYHVKDAIIHRFDPRPCCFPDAIHATTQDRRGRLSIWMLRRGRSLLPWHGVGCLDERGRAEILHAMEVFNRVGLSPSIYRRRRCSVCLSESDAGTVQFWLVPVTVTHSLLANFRFGSEADLTSVRGDVCLVPLADVRRAARRRIRCKSAARFRL